MANLTGRSFSQALIFLKAGFSIRRTGWSPGGGWIDKADCESPDVFSLSNRDFLAEDWEIQTDVPPLSTEPEPAYPIGILGPED